MTFQTKLSPAQMQAHIDHGSWRKLASIAQEITESARKIGGSFFSPVMGGGTRLMLEIAHRVSDDIDLFIDSPNWLGYVSPRLNEDFEDSLRSYSEESSYVKWQFDEGEIDFIVGSRLLNTDLDMQNGLVKFPLESIAEVLAKKLFYRGWAITPRDVFDWCMIERLAPLPEETKKDLGRLLGADRTAEIRNAIAVLPTMSLALRAWASIRTPFDLRIEDALDEVSAHLNDYEAASKHLADKSKTPKP